MKRTLNLRFLAILMAVVGVFGVGVHRLHGVQADRSAKILRSQADEARKKGDLAAAQGYIQRYLSYEPGDAEGLQSLGLLQAERAGTPRDHLQAMLTLEQALRRDPDLDEARRRVIEIAMLPEVGRFPEARAHLNEILDRLISSGKGRTAADGQGEIEYKLGLCAQGERKYEEAANWFRLARTHAPDLIDIYIHLAGLLQDQINKPKEADLVMDAREVKSGLVKANPKSSRAYLERARYRQRYSIDGVDQDVAKALELAPDDLDTLLAAAQQALGRRDFESARTTLARALKSHAPSEPLFQAQAAVEIGAGQFGAAEEKLRQGIETLTDSEDRARLLWSLANVQLDRGTADAAKETIRRMRKERFKPELLSYLEACVRAVEGRWNEAAQQLEAVHPLLVDKPELAYKADLLLGRCHERLGAIDHASAAYRRAVNLDPLALPARLGLASTVSAMGQIDDALEIYRSISPLTPDLRITIARRLVIRNLRKPSERRDWREADQALDDAAAAAPESPEVPMLRAEALAARGRDAEARSVLTEAQGRFPESPDFWTALAALNANRGQAQASLKEIDEAQHRLGDRVEIRLARADYWARIGGSEAIRNLAPLAEKLDAFSTADQRRLLGTLAVVHRRLDDLEGARRLLDRVVPLAPDDLGVRLVQFDLALQAGDDTDLQTLLGQIRALDDRHGDGTAWRYAQARYLIWSATRSKPIDRKRLEQARPILVELGLKRPSWALVPLSEAEIDDSLSNPDGALAGYLRAIELGNRQLEVIRRTVQLLNAKGRYAQADEVIRELQKKGPIGGDTAFARMAAEVSLRANDPARALELARQAVPANSTDYEDHILLGQTLAAAGKDAEAEQELRQAVALKPDAPTARIALVIWLARAGKMDQAKAAVEEARKALHQDQAPLTLALCYATIGQLDTARQQFRIALASHPDDAPTLRGAAALALATGQTKEAETLLRSILDHKFGGSDTAWAQRSLATILAGDRQNAHEALALLGLDLENLTSVARANEPIEDRRAKAQVLAHQSAKAPRQAAIRLLDQIVASGDATPNDRILLAQLAESEADWGSAREQWRVLVTAQPDNSLYLAQYIIGLLRHNESQAAGTWLTRLEQIEPEATRTIVLKARWLVARGQSAEAVSLLQAFAKRPDAPLSAIAALLDELKQFDPAEEMYRLAARSEEPASILALADFLGRRGKSDEAIALCETARKGASPEQVAKTLLVSLFSSKADQAQTRRVSDTLQKALQENPKSAALVFELGNARLLEGRYDEAKTLFRRAFELDQTTTGPLNNLAWLLAVEGKGADALKLVNRAIEAAGPSPSLLDTRALAYLATGQRDAAIRDLEGAIATRPEPVMYFHLALARMEARNPSAAAEAFQKAQTAGLRDSDIHPLEQASYRKLQTSLANVAKK